MIFTMKPEPLPLLINDRFEKALFFLPKAPGAVIGLFDVFINEKNLFISESLRLDQVDGETQTGTACAGNDIIV